MTESEYINYLQRIEDIRKTTNDCPSSTLTLQIYVSVLRLIEKYQEMSIKLDRQWLEDQLAAAKNNSQG